MAPDSSFGLEQSEQKKRSLTCVLSANQRMLPHVLFQMERKERKSPASDTLYEVVSLESENEREKRKTTASPGIVPTGPGTGVPSPPEDDEEEGDWILSYFVITSTGFSCNLSHRIQKDKNV